MKRLLGCAFPEKWADINPRLAPLDSQVNLNIGFFSRLDEERIATIGRDCTPLELQDMMVKVSVALSYCNVMVAILGCDFNEMSRSYETLRAQKTLDKIGDADPTKKPKSEAAMDRALEIDTDLINLKWAVEDLKVAWRFADRLFAALTKDAEHWRARFYGANQDRKLTPGVEAPYMGDHGVPPPIGG